MLSYLLTYSYEVKVVKFNYKEIKNNCMFFKKFGQDGRQKSESNV